MEAPIAHLDERRGKLAKDWLLHVLDRSSLDEIERLPTARVVRELPELIGELLAEASGADARRGVQSARDRDWVLHLAQLAGREPADLGELSLDLALLQSLIVAELRRAAASFSPGEALTTVERLGAIFGAMQVSAVGDALELAAESRAAGEEADGTAATAVDRLTGLQAGNSLDEQLGRLVGMQKRYGHPFAILLLDVEGLKRINDAYGQDAGDAVLKGIAQALGGTIRSVDLPLRVGGDEFCVVAPDQTASGARVLGHRIATAIERLTGPGGQPPHISIGVASCPQHGEEAERLLELADGAMYRAKASGERVAVSGSTDEAA